MARIMVMRKLAVMEDIDMTDLEDVDLSDLSELSEDLLSAMYNTAADDGEIPLSELHAIEVALEQKEEKCLEVDDEEDVENEDDFDDYDDNDDFDEF